MDKHLRPIPYPVGSERRRNYIEKALRWGWAPSYRDAVTQVVEANRLARNTPLKKEKCEATTRRGTSCLCKALASGRCKFHGGLSTGPKTAEGRHRCALNLPNVLMRPRGMAIESKGRTPANAERPHAPAGHELCGGKT